LVTKFGKEEKKRQASHDDDKWSTPSDFTYVLAKKQPQKNSKKTKVMQRHRRKARENSVEFQKTL
jgi:hypothetical protein